MLSGLRHWFPTHQELYRKRLMLPCICYKISHDARNEWCALYTWGYKLYEKNVFWKIELEKLTNSKSGTKLSILWNLPVRSYGLQWLLGRCLHNNLLYDENLLRHQVTNAYHILRFPRKRHGQQSTKLIWFKVALGVNVSRVKNKPRPRV
jgi:hypothetical protein